MHVIRNLLFKKLGSFTYHHLVIVDVVPSDHVVVDYKIDVLSFLDEILRRRCKIRKNETKTVIIMPV